MTVKSEIDKMMLTETEAAKTLGISPRMMFKLERSGQIEAVRFGKAKRYHRDAIDAFARKGCPAA